MPSLERATIDYGSIDPAREDLITVHLLLYGLDGGAPTLEEAQNWSEHYDILSRSNHVVLLGDARMLGPKTRSMIPGLQLIDRNFVLRYDSAGRRSPHDMWTELLPAVRDLLAEPAHPSAY